MNAMFVMSVLKFFFFPCLQSTVLEHCEHCLKLYPLNELVGHSLNCSQRKDLGSLVKNVTTYSFFMKSLK